MALGLCCAWNEGQMIETGLVLRRIQYSVRARFIWLFHEKNNEM